MNSMNSRINIFGVVALCFLAIGLAGCSRQRSEGTQQSNAQAEATKPAAIKLPPKFGVFYETPAGPVELVEKTEVAAANPSFWIYLQNIPSANKLRLRLVKASGGSFIVDAGSVTSSESDKPKSPPKPGNYQNVFVLAYGEDAGVFEPQVTTVEGQSELFKASYASALKPGEYFAFYFIDESKGQKSWEEARFKFAGQFIVK
jgi:hypothetical protein